MLVSTGRSSVWAVSAVGVALGVGACGSDDSSSDGGTGVGGSAGSSSTGTNTASTTGNETTGGRTTTTSGTTGLGGSAGEGAGGSGGSGGAGGTAGSGGSGAGTGPTGGGAGEGGAGEEPFVPPPEIWVRLERLSPMPELPPDTTNRVADDEDAAALGQMLFFDEQFSGVLREASDLGQAGESGRVSCQSCHAGSFLDDDRSDPPTVSRGTGLHSRNAPALVDSSLYRWTNWGGRFSAQWELPLAVAENGVIMNGNRLNIAHRLFDVYRAEYEGVFGPLEPAIGSDPVRFPAHGKPSDDVDCGGQPCRPPWDSMSTSDQAVINTILVNYSKALAAYVRLLRSGDSPFDAWIAGDESALTDAAKRGAALFVGKADCVRCHSGPHFSDNRFHQLGVPQSGQNVPVSDDGRYKDVPGLLASPFNSAGTFSDDPEEGARRLAGLTNPMPEETRAAFRTPGLRGVAQTAPYMHSGQLSTLAEVIDFYNAGGTGDGDANLVPLFLSDEERQHLEAFLQALTGDPPADELLEDLSK